MLARPPTDVEQSPAIAGDTAKPRVLVVDDDTTLVRTYERILKSHGFLVDVATDGRIAADTVKRGNFDVVLSDIDMPGLDGIKLLRAVREYDLDLPVVLLTASPSVDTAIQALDYGALRYLIKPISPSDLVENLTRASRLRRLAAVKRESLSLLGKDDFQIGDRAGLETVFERGLESLWMAYQPIVCWSRREIFATEALVRCREPAMPNPSALFDAATRLQRLPDVSRRIRARVAQAAHELPAATFFVNLHPSDLLDEDLYAQEAPLSTVASRVVLEITERASLDVVGNLRPRIALLRRAGFRIAVDDLGAGYAGLASFAQLEPDVVKVDMSLVRDIHLNPTKRRVLRSLVTVCSDLRVLLVVEGVETNAERDTLIELGCDLLQGYLFARPAYPSPAVAW